MMFAWVPQFRLLRWKDGRFPLPWSGLGHSVVSRAVMVLGMIVFGIIVFGSMVGWGNAGRVWAEDAAARETPTAQQLEHFEKKIRPVLVQRCQGCHSEESRAAGKLKGGLLVDHRAGLLAGGDSGPAIVPGTPDKSLLLQALRYDDLEMPPSGKLPADVIRDFEVWIADGAVDPRGDGVGVKRAAIDIEQGRRHWCYQPPRFQVAPEVRDRGVTDGAIDRFLVARQAAAGLEPTHRASPEQLMRRLSYDLVGLPPTPAEVTEFAADESPDATARLVDRLLASPRYGERWARHWLDVARFAESLTLRGFIMPEAWRYRDYVIDSFNRDLPYDEFVRQQIAGDYEARQMTTTLDVQQLQRLHVATTYLVLGNTNLEEQDKKQLRMDFVDEQLDTIGKGILAQTLGCARCHDHKFDPIPTRDYYALAGILRSSRALEHANVSKWLEFPLPVSRELQQQLQQQENALAEVRERIKRRKTNSRNLPGMRARGMRKMRLWRSVDCPASCWTIRRPSELVRGKSRSHRIDILATVIFTTWIRIRATRHSPFNPSCRLLGCTRCDLLIRREAIERARCR